jgi:hypothetical protein
VLRDKKELSVSLRFSCFPFNNNNAFPFYYVMF